MWRPGLAAILIGGATAGPASAQDGLTLLHWLSGCWQSARGDRTIIEAWSPPGGTMLLGFSRTTVAGRTRAFEFLRLHVEQGTVVYTAIPSGQQETSFRATVVSDTLLEVSNPEHDFPTRIVYRRVQPDSIEARIEGPGPNGSRRGFTIAFGRIRCEAG